MSGIDGALLTTRPRVVQSHLKCRVPKQHLEVLGAAVGVAVGRPEGMAHTVQVALAGHLGLSAEEPEAAEEPVWREAEQLIALPEGHSYRRQRGWAGGHMAYLLAFADDADRAALPVDVLARDAPKL